tara:strand:+ start:2163 stop:2417 length:255 start_codon:yes stop_codon:yes gene_type:complete
MIEEITDEELYHHSMVNAYDLITKKKSLEDILDDNSDLEYMGFPFNPTVKVMNNDVYDKIIDYFCELEEYEKCQEILNIKNKNK